jgi:hypothetical protein
LGVGTDPSSYGNTIVADQGANYTGFSDQAGLLVRASSGTTGDEQHHGAISFSKGTGQAAISGVQEGSDADVLGLAFWTHSSSTGSAAAEERMRIDASGNVGIGTSSPSEELEIASSSPTIRLTDTDDSTYGAVSYNVGALFLAADQTIRFNTDSVERMRIK